MRRKVALVGMAMTVVLLAMPLTAASATSTGGCPNGATQKWVLASVEGLGVSPDVASGIASLDGNGDGNTCIRKLHPSEGTICNMENPIIFRDNTVAGSTGEEPLDCGFGPS